LLLFFVKIAQGTTTIIGMKCGLGIMVYQSHITNGIQDDNHSKK
jgi:hypothetical protein